MGIIAASFFSLSWSFLFACDEIVFAFFCQLVVVFFLSNNFHLRALLFLRNVCNQLFCQLCLFVKCKFFGHSTCFSVSVFIRNVSNQSNKKCFMLLFFCYTYCLRVKCGRCPIFTCFGDFTSKHSAPLKILVPSTPPPVARFSTKAN